MSTHKSRPPITYANTLDKPKTVKRAKLPPKSPTSTRPAFNNQKTTPLRQKRKKASQKISPKAEPKLQPKGMGEQGVNWEAHIARLRKARKAVRKARTVSRDFKHEKTVQSIER